MRTTKTELIGNPLMKRFILCMYSENENGEVKLARVAEGGSEENIKAHALKLYQEDKSLRLVLLTELVIPTSNW